MQRVLKRMQSLVVVFGAAAAIANAQAPSTPQASSAGDCTELSAVAAKLAIVAAWGVASFLVALRIFRWR